MKKQTAPIVTPEAFCWLYAAPCVKDLERKIGKGYFQHLMDCRGGARKPSDDVVRRIFRRPFETLGENCTLEEMQKYWRIVHQSLSEKTPVRIAVAMFVQKEHTYPELTHPNGRFWRVWYIEDGTPRVRELVENYHNHRVVSGCLVYIHGDGIAEATNIPARFDVTAASS